MGAGSRYGIFPGGWGTQQPTHGRQVRPGGWEEAADRWFWLAGCIHKPELPFFVLRPLICKIKRGYSGSPAGGGGRPKELSLGLTVSPQDGGGEQGAGLAWARDGDRDGEASPHHPGAPSGLRELTLAARTLCWALRAAPHPCRPPQALFSDPQALRRPLDPGAPGAGIPCFPIPVLFWGHGRKDRTGRENVLFLRLGTAGWGDAGWTVLAWPTDGPAGRRFYCGH